MGNFYICPTPIGNLKDISERLEDTLSEVDIVYAEDTRCLLYTSDAADE